MERSDEWNRARLLLAWTSASVRRSSSLGIVRACIEVSASQVHKMDVNGKKVKLSIWVSQGFLSATPLLTGSRIPRGKSASAPSRPRITAAPKASSWVCILTLYTTSGDLTVYSVYDVSNRESFDALPRWFSELEVSPIAYRFLCSHSCLRLDIREVRGRQDRCWKQGRQGAPSFLPISSFRSFVRQEFSRQVSTADGAAFAERQGALFVEASAKTAVGVAAAFTDVVGRILDTPALWADAAGTGGGTGVGAGAVAKAKAAKEMPGNITLDARDDEWEERPGGCNC
jgi:hypothetical protein